MVKLVVSCIVRNSHKSSSMRRRQYCPYLCVGVCGSAWECVAACGSVWECVAMCGGAWQCAAVCGSVWQCVAVRCSAFQSCSVLLCVAVFNSVLHLYLFKHAQQPVPPALLCVAMCCSVLQ